MRRYLRIAVPVMILIALGIYSSFPHPTRNQSTLKAVATESRQLIATHPISPGAHGINIPQHEWPPVIASLKPDSVTVRHGMVDIATKPYFDGGWGYGFAPDKQNLTMSVECWSELGHSVYWHAPC